MKAIDHFTLKPAVVFLAVTLSSVAMAKPANSANTDKHDTASVSTYSDWGNPAMTMLAIDSGRAIVEYLRTAQNLLDNNQVPQARSALRTARQSAITLNHSMPYLLIVEQLKNARNKLIDEDVSEFTADLLPIYASLDDLRLYAPEVAKRVTSNLQEAHKHVKIDNKQRAAALLEETANDIRQHTVYLPVAFVENQLHGALYALDQPQVDVADAKKAIDKALESLVTVIDEVVVPAPHKN